MIEEQIFYHEDHIEPFNWGVVKRLLAEFEVELRDTDRLWIEFCEIKDYNGFSIEVMRDREETEEEIERRTQAKATIEKWNRDLRYQQYLELKKEFNV